MTPEQFLEAMQTIASNNDYVMFTHNMHDESKHIDNRGVTFYVRLERGEIRKAKANLEQVRTELLNQNYIIGCAFTEDDNYMFNVDYIANIEHNYVVK